MTRTVLVLVACCLAAGPTEAGPLKVDRSIRKEPAYRSKAPRYGLLVFGAEGRDRVWLVLDGDTLHVDRNGNGDLTEPGEKIAAEKRPGRDEEEYGHSFEVGQLAVGGRIHKGLRVSFIPLKRYVGGSSGKRADVKAALAKDPKALAASVGVDVEVAGIKGGGVGGRVSYLAGTLDLNGVFQFGDTLAEAPVVHLGGPLQIIFYAERPALRIGRESDLVLVVGTPGVGPGTFAMVGYQDTIPADVRPEVEITYPPAKPGASPFREKFEIRQRC